MSHFTIWHYMVEKNIPSALILEDDFDMQEDFSVRLGECALPKRGHGSTGCTQARAVLEAGTWRKLGMRCRTRLAARCLVWHMDAAQDWNLMYVGRSPTEGDYRRSRPQLHRHGPLTVTWIFKGATEHLAEPGYTLWTVGCAPTQQSLGKSLQPLIRLD